MKELKPQTKGIRRREAKLEASDAATWECASCRTIIESGSHCQQCAAYWRDVEEGLWKDDKWGLYG